MMVSPRNVEAELDVLKAQLEEVHQLVRRIAADGAVPGQRAFEMSLTQSAHQSSDREDLGELNYSGSYYNSTNELYHLPPCQRRVSQLLTLDSDKTAKVLGALGHKQRLEILISLLQGPQTGPQLVEQLHMGTTGQLYHHTKALLGADLLVQEERGGAYSVPKHRIMPLLLLLSAATDLNDASDYMEMAEARSNAGTYLGTPEDEYDPHLLIRAVLENCIQEHQAGYCTEVNLFVHQDRSVTVADNGRGIPVNVLPGHDVTQTQSVLTDMGRFSRSASFTAPGGEQGISMAVVNALSLTLSVEIRREGRVYRQDYKQGIPQGGLRTIGINQDTGTSITFLPDNKLFRSAIEYDMLAAQVNIINGVHPELNILIHRE